MARNGSACKYEYMFVCIQVCALMHVNSYLGIYNATLKTCSLLPDSDRRVSWIRSVNITESKNLLSFIRYWQEEFLELDQLILLSLCSYQSLPKHLCRLLPTRLLCQSGCSNLNAKYTMFSMISCLEVKL